VIDIRTSRNFKGRGIRIVVMREMAIGSHVTSVTKFHPHEVNSSLVERNKTNLHTRVSATILLSVTRGQARSRLTQCKQIVVSTKWSWLTQIIAHRCVPITNDSTESPHNGN
jgi:hypothetical protein